MATIIPFRHRKENKDKQDNNTTEMEYKPVDPMWAFRWARIDDNREKE